jgi:hypothetical protein
MASKKKKNGNLVRGKIDRETLMLWGRDWIIRVLQCIHYVEETIGSKNTANFGCTSTGFQAPCFGGRNLSWCTCICYYYVSILGSYPSHFINAYGTNPTTQKNTVLPWCRGWLGLVIGSFRWAGRVVGLPRVPDGRAGVYNRAGCWAGVGGTSK